MNNLYPIYLKIKDKYCTVVGGGVVSYRKVLALLLAEATVTVISPWLCNELLELVTQSKVLHLNKVFQPGDLEGAFLVVAATDDAAVNQAIWQESNKRNILINVVDVPNLCNFYVPSVVRDGDLAVAISTNGKAPYLSKRLRLKLEVYLKQFNLNQLINQIHQKKQKLKALFPGNIRERETQIKKFVDDSFDKI